MNSILGLDVSTSCVGVALLNKDNGDIIKLDHIEFKGMINLWQKGNIVSDTLKQLNCEHKIQNVYIEDAAKKFASGSSSASVIATLMRFNGICSYIAWSVLNITPEFVAPSAARKLCGMKMEQTKKCGKPHKLQTFDYMMSSDLQHIVWPLKKSGKIVDWSFDVVDAYVIAKAGLILEQKK